MWNVNSLERNDDEASAKKGKKQKYNLFAYSKNIYRVSPMLKAVLMGINVTKPNCSITLNKLTNSECDKFK